MTNNSASGGALAPENTPAPLEGEQLENFLQEWVVAVSGLGPTFVRPRWTPEPANIPDAGEAWCALGIGLRSGDAFPYVGHVSTPPNDLGQAGPQYDELQNHELLQLLLSFYDLGAGALADTYAARMRDGCAIAQNREVLTRNGFGLAAVGQDLAPIPVVFKQRWMYRVDLVILVRRIIVRRYPVLNIESMQGTLTPDGLAPVDISVSE